MPHTTTLLLVEDDDVDALMLERALRRGGVENPMVRAKDGRQALEILRDKVPETSCPRPFIMLLDINMPRMSGIEFLSAIRADDKLKRTPVFILTTSRRDEDINAAYELQAAGFILKENAGLDFSNVVALLRPYLEYVTLPA